MRIKTIRPWLYLAAAFVIGGLALTTPNAWATSGQSASYQTVPTLTPSPTIKPPTPIVTPPGGLTPAPGQTSVPPAPGPQPGPGPVPGSGPVPAPGPQPGPAQQPGSPGGGPVATGGEAALRLSAAVNPAFAWAGTRLQFTVTLSNVSAQPLNLVLLDEYLAEGLEPLADTAPAAWTSRHMGVGVGTLEAGQRKTISFAAAVSWDARPGTVLQLVSIATAKDLAPVFVQTLIPLPPAELPRTGAPAAASRTWWPASVRAIADFVPLRGH